MLINKIKIGKRIRKDVGDLKDLVNSINTLGLLHPVVVDKNNNLIAGYRRIKAFEALKKKDVPVTVIDIQNIIKGECDENCVRKDFTPEECVDIWSALENHQGERELPSESDGSSIEPRKQVSKFTGLSTDSLSKAKAIIESGEKKIIQEMNESGNINKAFKKVSKFKRDERRSKAAKAVAVDRSVSLSKVCRIDCEDFRTWLPKIEHIDAIITDPPYPAEYLPLYEDLAKLSTKVPLVAVMCGQSYLPIIMQMMCSKLRYRWLLAYLTTAGGVACDIHDRGIACTWKPVLLFGEKVGYIHDLFKSEGRDKDHDIWGQNVGGMMDLVKRLTEPGQLVVDCFCGGGATAVACVKLNRRFAGCDIDANDVKTSWERCLIASGDQKCPQDQK